MVQIKLKSGVTVLGEIVKNSISTLSNITLEVKSPFYEKEYINKTSDMIPETMSNGTNRCVYISHKSRVNYKKPTTIVTIYNSTIAETKYL